MSKYQCNKCGKCCFQEIPITILDIHRIALSLNIDDRKVFTEKISENVSENTGLFKIKKREDSSCVFIGNNNLCVIQHDKPNACELFFCMNYLTENKDKQFYCNRKNNNSKIWEQSVSKIITKEYIKRNGIRWNEAEYFKAVSAIQDNIITNKNQKLRIGRNNNGQPICQIFNCKECKEKGQIGPAATITLSDIKRISSHLKISLNDFFIKYIQNEPNQNGVLSLHKKVFCDFFDPETHCSIEEVKPMNCRFTPCPKQTKTSYEFDTLYLGTGTIEEQYQHQVALSFTQEYVQKYDAKYNREGMKLFLRKIDESIKNIQQFEKFCEQISGYRFMQESA